MPKMAHFIDPTLRGYILGSHKTKENRASSEAQPSRTLSTPRWRRVAHHRIGICGLDTDRLLAGPGERPSIRSLRARSSLSLHQPEWTETDNYRLRSCCVWRDVALGAESITPSNRTHAWARRWGERCTRSRIK